MYESTWNAIHVILLSWDQHVRTEWAQQPKNLQRSVMVHSVAWARPEAAEFYCSHAAAARTTALSWAPRRLGAWEPWRSPELL